MPNHHREQVQSSLLRNKPVVAKVSTNTSTSGISPDVAELKDMVKALLLDKKSQNQSPAPVKAVEESCVTCDGAHSYRNCPVTDGISCNTPKSCWQRNIEYPRALLHRSIGQVMRTTTKHVVLKDTLDLTKYLFVT
nr:hypothetical protein [Tanacetum cinerariifolium]